MKPFIFVAIVAVSIAASPSFAFAQSDTDRLNAMEDRLQRLETRQHQQEVETMMNGLETDHVHAQMLNNQLTRDLDDPH